MEAIVCKRSGRGEKKENGARFLPDISARGLKNQEQRPVCISSQQFLQQSAGFYEIAGSEAFRKPTIARGEQFACRLALTLFLPNARQTGSGTQFQQFRLLDASKVKCLQVTMLYFSVRLTAGLR